MGKILGVLFLILTTSYAWVLLQSKSRVFHLYGELGAPSSSGEIVYGGLQHCGVLVSDHIASKKFYAEIFGFKDESHLRPAKLPYPGAFLRLGADQIHLMELPNPDPTEGRPEHGGRDRHVALTINNVDLIAERLAANDIKYTLSKSGRRALFTRDPDGNAYEFVEDDSL